MSKKSKLYTTAIIGLILDSMTQTSKREYYEKEQQIKNEAKNIIIKKGIKEYYFDYNGNFTTNKFNIADIDLYFTCVALNSKNAIKKINKYLKNEK